MRIFIAITLWMINVLKMNSALTYNKVEVSSTFTIYYRMDTKNIEFKLITKNKGFTYIGFGASLRMTDILMTAMNPQTLRLDATDMFSVSEDSLPRADVSFSQGTDNYKVLSQSQREGIRTIIIQRPLNTGDQYDFNIVNNIRVHIVWGQSNSETVGQPVIRGMVRSVLLSDSQICDEHCLSCNGPEDNQCVQCRPHYHLSNGKCIPCPLNCKECTSTTCLSCLDSYLLSPTNTCLTCNLSYQYANRLTGVCATCDPKCQLCGSDTSCFTCSSGYFLKKGQCIECPSNCLSCLSESTCIQCQSNHLLQKGQCTFCQQHFYLSSSNHCQSCHFTCLTCKGPKSDHCLSCSSQVPLSQHLCNYTCGQHCLTCTGPQQNQCHQCSNNYLMYNGQCYSHSQIDGLLNLMDSSSLTGEQMLPVLRLLVVISRERRGDQTWCNHSRECNDQTCNDNRCVCGESLHGQFCQFTTSRIIYLKNRLAHLFYPLLVLLTKPNQSNTLLLTLLDSFLINYDLFSLDQTQNLVSSLETFLSKSSLTKTTELESKRQTVIILDCYSHLLNILEHQEHLHQQQKVSLLRNDNLITIRALQQKVVAQVQTQLVSYLPSPALPYVNLNSSRIQYHHYYLDLNDPSLKTVGLYSNFTLTFTHSQRRTIIAQNNDYRYIRLQALAFQTYEDNDNLLSTLLHLTLSNPQTNATIYLYDHEPFQIALAKNNRQIDSFHHSYECTYFSQSLQKHIKVSEASLHQQEYLCQIKGLTNILSVQSKQILHNSIQDLFKLDYAFGMSVGLTSLLIILIISIIIFNKDKEEQKEKNLDIPLMDIKKTNQSFASNGQENERFKQIRSRSIQQMKSYEEDSRDCWMLLPIYSVIKTSNSSYAIQKSFIFILYFYAGVFTISFIAKYHREFVLTNENYLLIGYLGMLSGQVLCYVLGSLASITRKNDKVNCSFYFFAIIIYIVFAVFSLFNSLSIKMDIQHWIYLGLLIFYLIDFFLDIIICIIIQKIGNYDKQTSCLKLFRLKGFYQ